MFRGLAAGLCVGVFVLAAMVSGCGGGDDDQLSQAEYRKQATAICAQAKAEKDNGVADAYDDPAKAGITSRGAQVAFEILSELALPPIATMNEELRDLGGPEGEEEKAEQMVDAFEAEVAKLENNPKLVLTGGAEFAEANELARELGLKSCAAI